jgi:hypothetical protein
MDIGESDAIGLDPNPIFKSKQPVWDINTKHQIEAPFSLGTGKATSAWTLVA